MLGAVKLANAHGEKAIEERILWRGGLEAGQRAEIVARVVAHAGECHLDQRAVVRLERHPKIFYRIGCSTGLRS